MTQPHLENDKTNIEKKLLDVAVSACRIAQAIVDSESDFKHIADQLRRSATAPGAHYAEARSAQSKSEFRHKLALAAQEAREALYWLELAEEMELTTKRVATVIGEANEVVAILHASLQTAQSHDDQH